MRPGCNNNLFFGMNEIVTHNGKWVPVNGRERLLHGYLDSICFARNTRAFFNGCGGGIPGRQVGENASI